MAKVNVSFSALDSLAYDLESLGVRLGGLALSIKNEVKSKEKWDDPRAAQFRDQANAVCKGLEMSVANFAQMGKVLKAYAIRQKEISREVKSKIDNIR